MLCVLHCTRKIWSDITIIVSFISACRINEEDASESNVIIVFYNDDSTAFIINDNVRFFIRFRSFNALCNKSVLYVFYHIYLLSFGMAFFTVSRAARTYIKNI